MSATKSPHHASAGRLRSALNGFGWSYPWPLPVPLNPRATRTIWSRVVIASRFLSDAVVMPPVRSHRPALTRGPVDDSARIGYRLEVLMPTASMRRLTACLVSCLARLLRAATDRLACTGYRGQGLIDPFGDRQELGAPQVPTVTEGRPGQAEFGRLAGAGAGAAQLDQAGAEGQAGQVGAAAAAGLVPDPVQV